MQINNENLQNGYKKVLDKYVSLSNPKNRKIFLVVFLILIFSLAIASLLGFLPLKNNENTPLQNSISRQTIGPCANLSADPGEISCEEAKKIVFDNYPDPILSIDKKTIIYSQRGVEGSQEKNIWLFTLKPSDEQLEKVEIAVDRKTKEVLFTQPYFKE